jgi:hypothetical protein
LYDRRIMDWLSGFEDSICGAIVGLVARAHAVGKPGPHAVVFDLADGQDTRFVLTEALAEFAIGERYMAADEGGNPPRERWAERADAMRDQIEAAVDGAR